MRQLKSLDVDHYNVDLDQCHLPEIETIKLWRFGTISNWGGFPDKLTVVILNIVLL